MRFWSFLTICILLSSVIWHWPKPVAVQKNARLDLNNVLNHQTNQKFSTVDKLRLFEFPNDHLAHPDYRIEWWYLTGNLKAENGNSYGYQITFFRTALQSNPPQRTSQWATNQIWMGHFAISDISQQKHYQTQRLSRESMGLAGILQQPFKLWLEDWQITAENNGEFPWHIKARDQQISIDLTVNPLKPVVLQGDKGLSQKSATAGNASYYYSFTRLNTTGTISVNNNQRIVSGLSWLDREWSSSALGKNQSGWDWFSLQLNTGEDLMYYRMRNTFGESDQHSQGKWIKVNGQTIPLNRSNVILKPLDYWQSETGASYPISWQLTIPQLSKNLLIKAAINDQLMRTSIQYWEGSVSVFQSNNSEPIGNGYLEMTGY